MDLVGQLEVLPDVAYSVLLHQDPVEPVGVVAPGHDGDQEEPEPEDDEDLLVEQVDGQDALDGVALQPHEKIRF